VPGHTPGQIGLFVEEGDHTIFLAGDSSYRQDLMLRGKVDGVGGDEEAERLTHERIRAYAARIPPCIWSRTIRRRQLGLPSGGSQTAPERVAP
jgi:glyoxylase-like metal-dependent hydrolase (beta-lactamase superfamily II)